ncbi:hypothetical protein DVV14_00020 [Vibrio coralliilyticus]|nr:hypothetical protein DVV14_00020 [Vibrio coralliilyticus]
MAMTTLLDAIWYILSIQNQLVSAISFAVTSNSFLLDILINTFKQKVAVVNEIVGEKRLLFRVQSTKKSVSCS